MRRLIADPLLWIAAAGALALSLAFATTFDRDAGRWGGVLWFAASKLPAIGGRNLLFPPLSVLAAVVLVCAWRRACAAGHGRGAAILLLSMLGWLAAQVLNSQAWQRYCEPIVLLELIWLAALAAGPGTGSAGGQPGGAGRIRGSAGGQPGRHGPAHLHGPARWIGPVLLGLLLLGISAYTLYYGVYVDLTGRQS